MSGDFYSWRLRRTGSICLLLLLAALVSPVVLANDGQPAEAGFDTRLQILWQDYLQAKIAEDEQAREQVFDEIKGMMNAAGATIFEKASYLFLDEGYQDLSLGRHDSARREFINAADLNPYLWPAYSGLAEVRLEMGGSWWDYLELELKGFTRAFDLDNGFFILGALEWVAGNLIWTAVLCFILITLLLCLKYVRPFYFTTLGAMEEKGIDALYAHLVAIALLLLPLLLGANLFLMAAIYIVLFIPFLDVPERYAAYLVFLFPIVLPFLTLFSTNVSYARSDPLLRAHLAHFYEGGLAERVAFLQANAAGNEHADLSLFTIASLQKAEGLLSDALETYAQIPEGSELWAAARINRGNIHYLRKEYQDATDAFQAAIDREPQNALARYNLSFVKQRQGDLQESERLRQQALRDDRDLQEKQLAVNGPIEANADTSERLFEAIAGASNPSLEGSLTDPRLYAPMVLSLIILGIAMLHLRLRNPHVLARNCQKCGRIFFQSDSPETEWCSQCVNLYIRKEDLPSEAKIRKHEEVQRYNRTRRWIMITGQVFLPGSRKIASGNPVSGLLILFVWSLFLIFIFSPVSRIDYDFMRHVEGPVIFTIITALVAIVYWAIFGLRSIWQED